jgi:hypothetical protein
MLYIMYNFDFIVDVVTDVKFLYLPVGGHIAGNGEVILRLRSLLLGTMELVFPLVDIDL